MKKHTPWSIFLLLGGATVGPFMMAQDADETEEVFTLSPFTVDGSDDEGYRASSTLAGTRLNTNLNEIGSAISVITEEFMDDVGITSADELLTFTPNTEVGGLQGNFAGGVVAGRVDQTSARENPQGNQRVRGLSSAQLTRDYFRSSIPFDRYNTTRVTLNRGPNSILFGVGSVAGVVNNTTKKASFGDLPTVFRVTLDDEGSHRETIDYNKVLIDNRLAVRFNVLNEDQKYAQKPAFEEDRRFFAAVTAVLREGKDGGFLGRSTLRANFEVAESEANPPNPIPPNDGITNWFSYDNVLPRETYEDLGIVMPNWISEDAHVPKFTRPANGPSWGKTALGWTYYRQLGVVFDGNEQGVAGYGLEGSSLQGGQGSVTAGAAGGNNYKGSSQTSKNIFQGSNFVGFTIPVLDNTEIFDYENLLFRGDTNRRYTDYDVQNVQFEQILWDGKAGLELAFDNQSFDRESFLPFTGPDGGSVGTNDVVIDINETLNNSDNNGDGAVLNPNVGRPMVRQQGLQTQYNFNDRQTFRGTAYVQWDARENFDGRLGDWLGSHTLNTVYSHETTDTLNYTTGLFWDSNFDDGSPYTSARDWAANADGQTAWNRQAVALVYVGDAQFDSDSVDDVRLNQIVADLPRVGDSYRLFYRDNATKDILEGDFILNEHATWGNVGQTSIKSWSGSLHSKLFHENIVGLLGYRHDQVSVYRGVDFNNDDDDTTFNKMIDPELGTPTGAWDVAQMRLDQNRDILGGKSLSWSVVAKFPEDLLFELPFNSDLNVFYNYSDSFDPTSGRRVNVLGEVLDPPQGETEEYGFMLDMFERKVSIRANWFKTVEAQRSVPGGVGGAVNWSLNNVKDFLSRFKAAESQDERPFYDPDGPIDPVEGPEDALRRIYTKWVDGVPTTNYPDDMNVFVNGDGETVTVNSYDDMYALIGSLIPEPVRSTYNLRYDRASDTIFNEDLGSRVATSDSVAEGFEFEMTANPIKGLRLTGNVAFQETTLNNVAPTLDAFANEIAENIQASGLANLRDTPNTQPNNTYWSRYEQRVLAPLAAEQTKEGQVSIEQRKWRANFVANYTFTDGRFQGFGIGGAVRWQSKIATGYPQYRNEAGLIVPILEDAFYDPAIWSGNTWISYNKKLKNGIDWTARLNVSNAFGDDDVIPVRRNPDGALAVFRIAPPTKITLSNTFKF